MSKLANQRIPGATWDSATGLFEVSSMHALIQASGYLKYAHGQEGFVYFRGQPKAFPSMLPALYRSADPDKAILARTLRKRDHAISAYAKLCRSEGVFSSSMPDFACEGILQHYGVATAWLDLVDNIWTALWFACNSVCAVSGAGEDYFHYEPRSRRFPSPVILEPCDYAYVVVLKSGHVEPVEGCPGRYIGRDAEVVDLRIAAPSTYLRPHAQHGVVMRGRGNDDADNAIPGDLSSLVVGTIRIEIGLALDWLGRGDLLTTRNLFPPPTIDLGYRELLERSPEPQNGSKVLRRIGIVGP